MTANRGRVARSVAKPGSAPKGLPYNNHVTKLERALNWIDRNIEGRMLLGGAIVVVIGAAFAASGAPHELADYVFFFLVLAPFFIPRRVLWIYFAALGLWIFWLTFESGPLKMQAFEQATGIVAGACFLLAAWRSFRKTRFRTRQNRLIRENATL